MVGTELRLCVFRLHKEIVIITTAWTGRQSQTKQNNNEHVQLLHDDCVDFCTFTKLIMKLDYDNHF